MTDQLDALAADHIPLCGICGDYSANGVEVHVICLDAAVRERDALREAGEIAYAALRQRERAAGKVIASSAAIFIRSRLDGLQTTPEIEADARALLDHEAGT